MSFKHGLPVNNPYHQSIHAALQSATRPAYLQTKPQDWSTAEPGRRLDLDLDVHASWQIEPHQGLNRLCARFEHVNQTSVSADLKLIA